MSICLAYVWRWAGGVFIMAVTAVQEFPWWLNWKLKEQTLNAEFGVFPQTFPVNAKIAHTTMAHLNSVSIWAFVFNLYFGVSSCYFSIPLKIYTGKFSVSSVVDLTPLRRATSDANGLSLAADPTGTVNFLDMVNNLEGDSGRGYYIEMSIGTPGQKVTLTYPKHRYCL